MPWQWRKVVFLLALSIGGAAAKGEAWAIVVDTSRYWHNYRHFANALAMREAFLEMGMPEERVLFMSAESVACDPRNPFMPIVQTGHGERDARPGCPGVRVQGEGASVSELYRVLTGRQRNRGNPLFEPDEGSRVALYMTGHGGNGFFKFHDQEQLSEREMAAMIEDMALSRRFQEMLLILDTCQAASMGAAAAGVGNVTLLASSHVGENSYSYLLEPSLGVSLADRFSHFLSGALRSSPDATLASAMTHLRFSRLRSTVHFTSSSPSFSDPSSFSLPSFLSPRLPARPTEASYPRS